MRARLTFRSNGRLDMIAPTFKPSEGVPEWAMYAAACGAMFGNSDTRQAVIGLYLQAQAEDRIGPGKARARLKRRAGVIGEPSIVDIANVNGSKVN